MVEIRNQKNLGFSRSLSLGLMSTTVLNAKQSDKQILDLELCG